MFVINFIRLKMPLKVSSARRKDRPKKRKQSFNPKNPEVNANSFTSATVFEICTCNNLHGLERRIFFFSITTTYKNTLRNSNQNWYFL